MKRLLLTGVMVSIFATSAMAAPAFAGVNQRQEHQKQRIKNGVKSGELTRAETANLIQDQRHINRVEQRMRADDGGLSNKERVRLAALQNAESREIYRKKHNARVR